MRSATWPLPLQAKLLRVLQERTLERLGSNAAHPIDVRVICATSRNLEKMVQEGTFREDLYFRISVVRIHMPALRETSGRHSAVGGILPEDVCQGPQQAAKRFHAGFCMPWPDISWPGNVRELQNVIERSLVLADGNERLA